MRDNEDGKTVDSFDLLVPGKGTRSRTLIRVNYAGLLFINLYISASLASICVSCGILRCTRSGESHDGFHYIVVRIRITSSYSVRVARPRTHAGGIALICELYYSRCNLPADAGD